MSDIKAGDLVMVTRPCPCCGVAGSIGKVFKVLGVCLYQKVRCTGCGAIKNTVIAKDGQPEFGIGFEVSRLTKIDPPALTESILQREDIPA